jgi:hypothetical protein
VGEKKGELKKELITINFPNLMKKLIWEIKKTSQYQVG